MSEFKGKWERITVDWDLHQAVFVEDREIEICRLKGTGVETVANAVLISKAPEMLEMLKKCKEAMLELMCAQDGWDDDYEELENLIKEATTI